MTYMLNELSVHLVVRTHFALKQLPAAGHPMVDVAAERLRAHPLPPVLIDHKIYGQQTKTNAPKSHRSNRIKHGNQNLKEHPSPSCAA
jgi:hypothetical protein